MPLPRNGSYTSEDYWSLPDEVRAELIDGELWNLASPSRAHQRMAWQSPNPLVDPVITIVFICAPLLPSRFDRHDT